MPTLQLPAQRDSRSPVMLSMSAVGSVAPLLGTRASSGTPQLSLCSLPNATGGFSFKGKREKKRVLVLLRRRRGVTGEPLTMQ